MSEKERHDKHIKAGGKCYQEFAQPNQSFIKKIAEIQFARAMKRTLFYEFLETK